MAAITRSGGLTTGMGFVVGGGYRGVTPELDAVVVEAAEALRGAYGMDVTIRFNSDRRSGGAWLLTHAEDGFGRNSEIGIGASVTTEEDAARFREKYEIEVDVGLRIHAHIGHDALRTDVANRNGVHPYYHDRHASLAEALAFVQLHGSIDHLRGAA